MSHVTAARRPVASAPVLRLSSWSPRRPLRPIRRSVAPSSVASASSRGIPRPRAGFARPARPGRRSGAISRSALGFLAGNGVIFVVCHRLCSLPSRRIRPDPPRHRSPAVVPASRHRRRRRRIRELASGSAVARAASVVVAEPPPLLAVVVAAKDASRRCRQDSYGESLVSPFSSAARGLRPVFN